jgi:hypothetical protein
MGVIWQWGGSSGAETSSFGRCHHPEKLFLNNATSTARKVANALAQCPTVPISRVFLLASTANKFYELMLPRKIILRELMCLAVFISLSEIICSLHQALKQFCSGELRCFLGLWYELHRGPDPSRACLILLVKDGSCGLTGSTAWK